MEEKRGVWISRAPRADLDGDVVVVTGEGDRAAVSGANVSETGILVASPSNQPAPELGENVQLIFDLPQLDAALCLEARVVRRAQEEEDRILLAMEFEDVPATARRALRSYVSAGKARGSRSPAGEN